MAKNKYYAVKNGRVPGIYSTWDECKKQVDGYSGAEYKSFLIKADAEAYIKGSKETTIVSENAAIAYVDGSYLHSIRSFSYGAILMYKGQELEFKEAFDNEELASMRNVAGEIKGAEFIMKYCVENNIPEIEIYYDYEGIEKWCTGVWQANKEGTKHYREVYLECSKKVIIHFHKVKGHSGNEYNDRVDSLAKAALGIK